MALLRRRAEPVGREVLQPFALVRPHRGLRVDVATKRQH
jgi:hypothetical protein